MAKTRHHVIHVMVGYTEIVVILGAAVVVRARLQRLPTLLLCCAAAPSRP